jgi:hypothetical protein
MSNRSAKFVSALFASILAGANFAAVAENGTKPAEPAKTADNCLSAPKGAVPAGSHWYYRLDRATKRQCWYIGEDKNKAARAAPQDSSVSSSAEAADPAPPQQPPAVSKSVADARAEWTSPKSSVAPDTSVTGATPAIDNGQRATAPDSLQSSAIASRWPDASEASSSNSSQLAAADLTASAQANENPAQEPAVSPVALTAANSYPGKPSNSTQTLLMIMASALAFAGLVGTVIFRFGRKPASADVHDDRLPAPWDSMHIHRPSPPLFMHENAPVRRAEVAQEVPVPGDAEKRIAEMLARLSRSATA